MARRPRRARIASKSGHFDVPPEDLHPKHIDHPGINEGTGYDIDQAWVIYQEGDREGTTGLHPIDTEMRPEDFDPGDGA